MTGRGHSIHQSNRILHYTYQPSSIPNHWPRYVSATPPDAASFHDVPELLHFSIQVKLENVIWGFYLGETPITDWITGLREFPGSLFIKDYAEIIKLKGFH